MPDTGQPPSLNDPRSGLPYGVLRIVLLYAAFAGLWTLLSDKVMSWLFSDPVQITLASTLKGWLFVAVTSLLLYHLMRRLPAHGAQAGLTAADTQIPHRFYGLPLIVLVAIIVGLTLAAIANIFSHEKAKEAARLQAIADLKTRQIIDWLKERQGDAKFMQASRFLAVNFRRWRETGDVASRDQLASRLEDLRQTYGYSAILLLDGRGERVWGSARAPLEIAPPLREAARKAAVDLQVHRVGPYRDMAGSPRLDFVAPLMAAGAHSPLIVLHTDPTDWLSKTLQTWPAPSASGETLLYRRDGDQVLYLNELRHRTDTALKLQLPVATQKLLAAQALRGEVKLGTLMEGADYRNVPAMGVARAIPGTDWFLIAKLDRSELYAEATRESVWIGLTGLLILCMSLFGLYLLGQRQQMTLALNTREAQAERLRALRLLAAIADSSNDAIFAKDMQGHYLLFNPAAARFTGKTCEEVLGRDDTALFPPEQAARIMANDRQVIQNDMGTTFQETLNTPDGEATFLATTGPLHDDQGKVIGLFGIARDITEFKRAEAALRESEGRFRALVEQSLAGIYIIQDGQLRYVNPGFAAIFGYDSPQALIGHVAVADLISPEDRELVAETMRRRVEGEVVDVHYVFAGVRRDGGRIDVEVHGRAFDYQGRPAVIGLILDITARKAAEAALYRQADELRSRNDELERFNRATVGRELDMIALKQQVNALSGQLGQKPPYALSFLDTPSAQPEDSERK